MTDAAPLAASHTQWTALVGLLDRLAAEDYAFVTPTPSTHRRVASRLGRARPDDLRDIFGWGRLFAQADLDPALLATMRTADIVVQDGPLFRSAVRVSTLDGRLHLHSARSDSANAVFLGPDSYRFVRFLDAVARQGGPRDTILDVGAGAGAGALAMAARSPGARVVASDVNPLALTYLTANAAHSGLAVETVQGPGPQAAAGLFDLVVANPPYVADSEGRTYRDGGGALGADLALDWVEAGLARLRPQGRFALYTGSPVVEGRDLLRAELERLAGGVGARLAYEELDPDIFGGMRGQEAYSQVERIAAVGAVLTR